MAKEYSYKSFSSAPPRPANMDSFSYVVYSPSGPQTADLEGLWRMSEKQQLTEEGINSVCSGPHLCWESCKEKKNNNNNTLVSPTIIILILFPLPQQCT